MIIVNYHNILGAPPNAFNRLVRQEWEMQDEFERQIAALCEHFNIVPLHAIVDAVRQGKKIPRACAITFDDGNLGAYKYGLPVLARRQAPAAFFIITRRVRENGQYAPYYFDRLEAMVQLTTKRSLDLSDFGYGVVPLADDEQKATFFKAFRRRIKVTPAAEKAQLDMSLDRQLDVPEEKIAAFLQHEAYQMMSWEQIGDLLQKGHSVGGHTRTHPSLSQINDEQLEFEIHGAFVDLREKLGLQEMPFAYPFGNLQHISEAAIAAVKRAGYYCAVTALKGKNKPGIDLFQLRRTSFDRAVAA